MKQLLTILLLIPSIVFSQVKKEDDQKSKLEAFSEKSGSLMRKTFIDIKEIKNLKIQVLVLEDVISNVKESGLRLEVTFYTSLSSEPTIAFLDKDEVDGLLQTLNYFRDKVFGTTPENYTELSYTSRSGFYASAFRPVKEGKDGKEWQVVFRPERFDSRSRALFTEKDLPDLITAIEQAKAKL